MLDESKPIRAKTQEVLIEMLRENTGRHMLDSGGAYGRNWERNQEREFLDEPTGKLAFRVYEGKLEMWDCSLNVFHWLDERVEFEPEMQKRFDAFVNRPEYEDEGWVICMEDFAKSLGGKGIYGDGEPVTVNTYNNEDMLSQILQFVYFEIEDSEDEDLDDGGYIALQIHGGCDARGGYTSPKLFSASIEEYSILDNARATIVPEADADAPEQLRIPIPGIGTEETPYWDTDNAGYTWSSDCYENLGDYPVIESDDPTDWSRGTVRVDSEGNGYCPVTGERLGVYSY